MCGGSPTFQIEEELGYNTTRRDCLASFAYLAVLSSASGSQVFSILEYWMTWLFFFLKQCRWVYSHLFPICQACNLITQILSNMLRPENLRFNLCLSRTLHCTTKHSTCSGGTWYDNSPKRCIPECAVGRVGGLKVGGFVSLPFAFTISVLLILK